MASLYVSAAGKSPSLEVMNHGINFLAKGELDKAIGCLLISDEIEPGNYLYLHNIALCYLEKGRRETESSQAYIKAEFYLQKALSYNMSDNLVGFMDSFCLGTINMHASKWKEALARFSLAHKFIIAMNHDPKFPELSESQNRGLYLQYKQLNEMNKQCEQHLRRV